MLFFLGALFALTSFLVQFDEKENLTFIDGVCFVLFIVGGILMGYN